jgi:hypothetical protein
VIGPVGVLVGVGVSVRVRVGVMVGVAVAGGVSVGVGDWVSSAIMVETRSVSGDGTETASTACWSCARSASVWGSSTFTWLLGKVHEVVCSSPIW